MSNALSKEKLQSDSLVKILWPKEKCRLIRDDVILVDRYSFPLSLLRPSLLFFSPGIDVSLNLDQWIENHCLDADVFILVVSAESTLAGAVSPPLTTPRNLFSSRKRNSSIKSLNVYPIRIYSSLWIDGMPQSMNPILRNW